MQVTVDIELKKSDEADTVDGKKKHLLRAIKIMVNYAESLGA